jgi:hypothetical protein
MTALNFGQLFIESKGQPLAYKGKSLILSDRVPAACGQRFTVTIESTASSYPQGIGISENVRVFDDKARRAVVWEYFSLPPHERGKRKSALPFSFEVECRNKKGWLSFYNMAECNGQQSWWHAGSCMWVESIAGGRRYHCNDFELDDDFDDLVFTVTGLDAPERVPATS